MEKHSFWGKARGCAVSGGGGELPSLKDCPPPCSPQKGSGTKPPRPSRGQQSSVTSQTFGNANVPRIEELHLSSFLHRLYLVDFRKTLCHMKINLERWYIRVTQSWLFTNTDKRMKLHNLLCVCVCVCERERERERDSSPP